jgi:hypothetical protein
MVGVLDGSTSPPKERYAVSKDDIVKLIQPGSVDDQLTSCIEWGACPVAVRREASSRCEEMSVRNGHYECCYHPVRVQPVLLRSGALRLPRRQRARRRRLGGRAEAGRGALSWQAFAHLFPRRRRIRQSMHIPNPSGSNTPFGSPPSTRADRQPVEPPGRASAE